MYFIIVEINNHAVVCYQDGEPMQFSSFDYATEQAVKLSRVNPGVWEVQPMFLHSQTRSVFDKRTHSRRLKWGDAGERLELQNAEVPLSDYWKRILA